MVAAITGAFWGGGNTQKQQLSESKLSKSKFAKTAIASGPHHSFNKKLSKIKSSILCKLSKEWLKSNILVVQSTEAVPRGVL